MSSIHLYNYSTFILFHLPFHDDWMQDLVVDNIFEAVEVIKKVFYVVEISAYFPIPSKQASWQILPLSVFIPIYNITGISHNWRGGLFSAYQSEQH